MTPGPRKESHLHLTTISANGDGSLVLVHLRLTLLSAVSLISGISGTTVSRQPPPGHSVPAQRDTSTVNPSLYLLLCLNPSYGPSRLRTVPGPHSRPQTTRRLPSSTPPRPSLPTPKEFTRPYTHPVEPYPPLHPPRPRPSRLLRSS